MRPMAHRTMLPESVQLHHEWLVRTIAGIAVDCRSVDAIVFSSGVDGLLDGAVKR